MTFNNINVSHSNVGVLNTGSIKKVDVALTAITQAGNPELSAAITTFTNAVLAHADVVAQAKDNIVGLVEVIASEATQSPEKRRKYLVRPVILEIATLVSGVADLASLFDRVRPILEAAFN